MRSYSEIKENLAEVEKRIALAAARAGRDRKDITLIAVSKTKPDSAIMEAYEEGIRDFGENKVQELVGKAERLPSDIRWHMIGHLQRNKVKYVVGRAVLIHGVDSLSLAEEISRQAVKKELVQDILLEVNIGDEESKFGVDAAHAPRLATDISKLPNIRLLGLMCIAPFVTNPEDNRKYFIKLRELSVDIKNKLGDNSDISVLSMGMTGDYEVAVEEGAAYIRVGTGIFGERNVK